ncbi:MAG: hypothetical protein ACW964_07325 [Candidatus Hodarchaeales archaeon]|jgi:hypothetical protein
MNHNFYLERKTEDKKPQIISLGVFTGNTFYPTMPHAIFEILVKENSFKIIDDSMNKFSLTDFEITINNTFTNNPPVISLNKAS